MMDTSKTYIKMADCPEIQGHMPRDHHAGYDTKYIAFDRAWVGCLVYEPKENSVFVAEDGLFSEMNLALTNECVWLPYRNQLQAMSGLHWREFDSKSWDMVVHYGRGLESKEMAGLMTVMHELHGKVWDGEKWIKGNDSSG